MDEIRQEKAFKIQGIELVSFSIQPQQATAFHKDALEFNIQQEQKTNAEKRLLIVFTTVTIKEAGKNSFLANLQVACGFGVPSFESLIKSDKKGNFILPHDLNIAISGIAIATTRGILYAQLRGSYLQNLILPLLPIE
ncbi:hypothetical protein [Chitinophaga defluvii]|uniref:Uncharacterized protein n=1 Tax=Chitinophaga defluvii TaxID=3163343 RepID=A0ABV2TAP2_9BACT